MVLHRIFRRASFVYIERSPGLSLLLGRRKVYSCRLFTAAKKKGQQRREPGTMMVASSGSRRSLSSGMASPARRFAFECELSCGAHCSVTMLFPARDHSGGVLFKRRAEWHEVARWHVHRPNGRVPAKTREALYHREAPRPHWELRSGQGAWNTCGSGYLHRGLPPAISLSESFLHGFLGNRRVRSAQYRYWRPLSDEQPTLGENKSPVPSPRARLGRRGGC